MDRVFIQEKNKSGKIQKHAKREVGKNTVGKPPRLYLYTREMTLDELWDPNIKTAGERGRGRGRRATGGRAQQAGCV